MALEVILYNHDNNMMPCNVISYRLKRVCTTINRSAPISNISEKRVINAVPLFKMFYTISKVSEKTDRHEWSPIDSATIRPFQFSKLPTFSS